MMEAEKDKRAGADTLGGSRVGWWQPLLKGQLAWTVGLAALWMIWLLFLPVDPDYTSGELLDHLLSWRETGSLYPDPTALPHRVLNYPPLFLLMVRALVSLGVPALVAGRILGSLGVLAALGMLVGWLRTVGVSSSAALVGLGLVGTSFPLLYSAGQFHLEGWAVAATLAGFWFGSRGDGWAILAGVALALGCFFKQTQVVLSLVALCWIWRHRSWREAVMAGVGFGVVGVVGCGLISLFFGAEAWRHMLSYTVGTFSLRQLGLQLGSFAFSWPVFVFFAFRASLGDRESRADPRTWYLLGAALWALSSIREGSSYAYFLDFHLAVLLWVIPLLDRMPSPRLSRAFALQMVGASVVVGGILGYDLQQAHLTEEALPALCEVVRTGPGYTVSGSPGLVRACGGRPALHPFITASLARQGLWDAAPFEAALAVHEFGPVLLSFDPKDEVGGVNRERWTEETLRIFRDRYSEAGRWGDWRVLVPVGVTSPR
jgi:hypothetical protein